MLLVADLQLVHHIAYLREWFSTKCHVVVAAEATGLFESEVACFCFRQYKKHIQSHIKFLAYFPKNESSLSNHQSACMYVCLSVCPPLITFEPLGRF
jgi:hypothetical protein